MVTTNNLIRDPLDAPNHYKKAWSLVFKGVVGPESSAGTMQIYMHVSLGRETLE